MRIATNELLSSAVKFRNVNVTAVCRRTHTQIHTCNQINTRNNIQTLSPAGATLKQIRVR